MKDEGFVPGAWPNTFILHPSSFSDPLTCEAHQAPQPGLPGPERPACRAEPGTEPRFCCVPIGALRNSPLLPASRRPAHGLCCPKRARPTPAPSWIDRVDVRDEKAPADVRNGIWGLLTDHQIRVDGEHVTDYYRNVRKVATSAGVQDASQLSIDFDPTYETLIVHEAAVIRDGKRMNGSPTRRSARHREGAGVERPHLRRPAHGTSLPQGRPSGRSDRLLVFT